MAGKDFFDLVKAIGECKSKQEEDRIITEEVSFLKKKIIETGITKKKLKELVIRGVYVELLGQDASFTYIKAVELCASTNIIQKKAGYLAAALFLSPDHEFRFMLVNQIQRDMKSTNLLECCAALSAVSKIVTPDMIPAVIGEVTKLLKHDMEAVRKRAVSALHRLYQMDPSCITEHVDKVRRILCDRDPSVMGASLVLLHALIQQDPLPFKDLVPSFISIIKQIIEHRLPREFDYHRIPAPWIQIQMLRILSLLGRGDQSASEGMYEVLVDVMRRADTGINVGYAIVYECVRTVTTIYPNPLLLDAAATAISRFIRSDSYNLKYIGIKGLATIVKDHPKYAADHQMAVIDCLEDPDETLKRKTLDLLFKMTNSVNVEFIVEKLLTFLANTVDDHFKADLVGRICQCGERFAPSNLWFVATMIRVFELAGDKVKPAVAQTLMQLIAEGSEDDDNEDASISATDELRIEAVEHFIDLLGKPKLPPLLSETMAWVLGEYGYMSTSKSKEEIMTGLCDLCLQSTDQTTRGQVITALMKLVAQSGVCPPKVLKLVNDLSNSSSLDVMQRCVEFKALLNSQIIADVLPVDASCEDIEVDEKLSFLDAYVKRALANGAVPYTPPSYLNEEDDEKDTVAHEGRTVTGFRYEAYEMPTIPVAPPTIALNQINISNPSVPSQPTGFPEENKVAPVAANQLVAPKNVPQVWGRKVEVTPPTPPAPTTPQPVTTSAPTPTQPQQPSPAAATNQAVNKPAEVAPPVPREPTEKEKMAAALFGGVGTTSQKSAGSRRKSNTTSTTASTVPTTATTLAPIENDSPPKETVKSNPPPPPQSNMLDLLDMSAPEPQHVAAPISPVQLQSTFDTFDGMTIQPTPLSPQNVNGAPPPPKQVTGFDAFAEIGGSSNDTLLPGLMDAPTPPAATVPATINFGVGVAHTAYRPQRLTTQEFGTRWQHSPAELKHTTQTSKVKTLDQLKAVMVSTGFFEHIESIVTHNEAIFGATLVRSAAHPGAVAGSLFLVHIKVLAQRSECVVTVKAPTRELAHELMDHLVQILR